MDLLCFLQRQKIWPQWAWILARQVEGQADIPRPSLGHPPAPPPEASLVAIICQSLLGTEFAAPGPNQLPSRQLRSRVMNEDLASHCPGLGQVGRATSKDGPGIGGGATPRLSLGVSCEHPLRHPFSLQT